MRQLDATSARDGKAIAAAAAAVDPESGGDGGDSAAEAARDSGDGSRGSSAKRAKTSAAKGEGRRKAQLKQQCEANEEVLNTIGELIDSLFHGVFIHRYRDTSPLIQVIRTGRR